MIELMRGGLTVKAEFVGNDLWVLVSGGEAPHIGAISVGIPRKSLTGDGSDSATVSTFNVTGHKDDAVGDMFAARLSAAFYCRTSVTAGIHFDQVDSIKLAEVMADAKTLLDDLEQALRLNRKP